MNSTDRSRGAFVAVDWGTSSFRGWLMAADGTVLLETRGTEGMLHCANSGFAPVLREHLGKLGADAQLPVLICGMAGAKQGWVEAPYLKTPTRLDALHDGAIKVDTQDNIRSGDVRILPGVAQAQAAQPDVMRGEETQLLGVIESNFTGLVCIPGTHSKWVRIEDGVIAAFTTYVTGELFAVLAQHSILMHAVDAHGRGAQDSAPFRDGLAAARAMPGGLTASLFRLRAAQLLGFEQRMDGASRLSGLLIGSEIADAAQRFGSARQIRLMGTGSLGALYQAALTASGFDVTMIDAEQASQRGLAKAAIHLWGAQFAP